MQPSNTRQTLPLSLAILHSISVNRHGQHEITFLPSPDQPRDGVQALAEPFIYLGRRFGHGQPFIRACDNLKDLVPCPVELQGRRQPNGFVVYSVRPLTDLSALQAITT